MVCVVRFMMLLLGLFVSSQFGVSGFALVSVARTGLV